MTSCTDVFLFFFLTGSFVNSLKENVYESLEPTIQLYSHLTKKKLHLLVQLVFLKSDCPALRSAVAGVAAPGRRGLMEIRLHVWEGEGMGEGKAWGSSSNNGNNIRLA